MAQEIWITSGLVGGVCTALIVSETGGVSDLGIGLAAVTAAVVSVMLWAYSPLPNRTVMSGFGDPEAGYWGFARDDDE